MGWVSQGQHLSWRRASFAGTKFGGGGKARAGKNSFPPTPFLFARPSDWISEFAVRIFVKKSSDFNQKAPPILRIRIAKFDAQKNFAQSLEYPDWKKSFGEGRGRIRL